MIRQILLLVATLAVTTTVHAQTISLPEFGVRFDQPSGFTRLRKEFLEERLMQHPEARAINGKIGYSCAKPYSRGGAIIMMLSAPCPYESLPPDFMEKEAQYFRSKVPGSRILSSGQFDLAGHPALMLNVSFQSPRPKINSVLEVWHSQVITIHEGRIYGFMMTVPTSEAADARGIFGSFLKSVRWLNQ